MYIAVMTSGEMLDERGKTLTKAGTRFYVREPFSRWATHDLYEYEPDDICIMAMTFPTREEAIRYAEAIGQGHRYVPIGQVEAVPVEPLYEKRVCGYKPSQSE